MGVSCITKKTHMSYSTLFLRSLLVPAVLLTAVACQNASNGGDKTKNDVTRQTEGAPPVFDKTTATSGLGTTTYRVNTTDANGCIGGQTSNASYFATTDGSTTTAANEQNGPSQPPPPPAPNLQLQSSPVEKTPDKIIRTGQMSLLVEDYLKARKSVTGIVQQHKGYIASENEVRNAWNLTNTIQIRVPSASFEPLMDGLSNVAKEVTLRSSNMQDVTAEYVDLEARLKAKREVEKNYIDLLAKAKSISESLEVQNYLGDIRAEIESMIGRMQYINDQASFSTLTLTLTQNFDGAPINKPGFGSRFGDAASAGWQGLTNFFLNLTAAWPALIIIAIIAWITTRFVKRQIRNYKEKSA